ncbi:MAG: ExeA family protein [Thermodesulfobacteriota bacterium]
MYTAFFGMREPPFQLLPDPRFFLFSQKARAAFEQLMWGVQNGTGFMMLTGEVGVGKTTLLRTLLRELNHDVERALVLNPMLGSSEELLKAILLDWGARRHFPKPLDKVDLLNILQRFLLNRHRMGRKVLLIIDDSQTLPDPLLEEVRLLSNLETNDSKLLQILLVGQPELRHRIESPRFRQLHQRIAIKANLPPLGREEVGPYLDHRLAVAGCQENLFSPRAVKAIAKASKGIPRLINLISDRCLLAGYVNSSRRIGRREVKMAIHDLNLR